LTGLTPRFNKAKEAAVRIIGVDPSSAKLAFVITDGDTLEQVVAIPLPPKDRQNTRSGAAYNAVLEVIGSKRAWVFLESPLYWRGGKSTIPLAQISGVVQAAVHNAGHQLEMVNNQRWKSRVIGIHNAKKDQIGEVMATLWPEVHAIANGDEDLIDAAAINMYGRDIMRHRKELHYRHATKG
jgi:Holliday junction resolvasome RuvABC endonuclease subunit